MSDSLKNGDRIEIRGFGSFALRFRKSRTGRNPKSGESVNIQNRYVPHFKPGKILENQSRMHGNNLDFSVMPSESVFILLGSLFYLASCLYLFKFL